MSLGGPEVSLSSPQSESVSWLGSTMNMPGNGSEVSLLPPQYSDYVLRMAQLIGNALDTTMSIDSSLDNPESDNLLFLHGSFMFDVEDDDAWTSWLAEFASANEARLNLQSASKESIENLDKVKIEDEGSCLTCSVCLEQIDVGCVATRMSCSHIYHQNCIFQWLVKTNTCPLCRYKMPAS